MRIETWVFRFLDKTYEVPVSFHPSTSDFVARLPGNLGHELTGKVFESEQKDTNFKRLKQSIEQMIKDREAELLEKEVTTKVIVYSVGLSGSFDYRVNGKKRTFSGEYRRAEDGVGIQISWKILFRSTLRGSTTYKNDRGGQEYPDIDGRDGEREMEWTERRQAFFESMDSRIQVLILQLHRFFKSPRKKSAVADQIDSGQLLLPAPNGIAKTGKNRLG